jgi:DNA (cytosine-5)-methyltransferase 1
MRFLDLFSGIGGFALGLEWAGHQTVAFCEIDGYCRQVLAKRWPHVPRYGDIRELDAARLRADGIEIDAICGGFPCQDISIAGQGEGIGGSRSGLWSEYRRLIGELRPRYVIVENVSALLSRGLDKVLGDLASLGFDAEWHCIPASAIGAPHRRDRVWIVAHPAEQGLEGCARERIASSWGSSIQPAGGDWWGAEPDMGRVDDRTAFRVDRLRSLGNAVVPQIPEIIGLTIND